MDSLHKSSVVSELSICISTYLRHRSFEFGSTLFEFGSRSFRKLRKNELLWRKSILIIIYYHLISTFSELNIYVTLELQYCAMRNLQSFNRNLLVETFHYRSTKKSQNNTLHIRFRFNFAHRVTLVVDSRG